MENIKITRILMPTDFSDVAENALKTAIAICQRQQASLTLLHIVDDFAFLVPSDVFFTNSYLLPDLMKAMEEKMRDLVQQLSDSSVVQIEGVIETGNPADAICRYASKESFDMIVMGTHGTSGIREFFLGSNAFRVVKHSRCPVLTVPGHWGKQYFKKILFPIRLLPNALDKYNYVKPIVEKNNSQILIAGIADSNRPSYVMDIALLIDKLKLRLHEEDVIFSTKLLPSRDFASTVLREAESYDAELIVTTADLDTEWKEFFIGPFAQQIVNHSKRPVLSIKSGLL